jgi:hypothetical protein
VREIGSSWVARIVDWYAGIAEGAGRRITTLQSNINKINIIIIYAIIVNVF